MVTLTITDAPTHGLPGHRCTLSVSVSATILSSNNTFMLSNSNNKQQSAATLSGNSFFYCLNVKFISSGGYVSTGNIAGKDILEFNQETESWTVIGAIKEPRIAHAV